ncbi:MAG: DUF6390 family protein [Candidatus Portnoybacteria bacterium]|nr:DUF6390 family protein [Candidatus Portnoybacteria bacterium]MDD4983161.1 DUF6390 family protein [Candidatus Portnoybacteria bacterium]
MASGPKIAALYGLIPNRLGFCGPQQELLKKFIVGKLSIPEIIPTLEKFEAAYEYYQLIARKNKMPSPFNKKVIEAYWLGNNLLDKITANDLRALIMERFCKPGLLSKKEAKKRADMIPADSKPHHSFHVLVLGSITGSVDFTGNTKLKDTCRVGWGRAIKLKTKNEKLKTETIVVKYDPLIGKNNIKFGRPIEKELTWDREILPSVEIGDRVSFHWNHAMQKLNEENIINLHKYTQNTLDTLYAKN